MLLSHCAIMLAFLAAALFPCCEMQLPTAALVSHFPCMALIRYGSSLSIRMYDVGILQVHTRLRHHMLAPAVVWIL
jgi:hypothetical protein